MTPIERTRLSLDVLWVGDEFGEGYFSNPNVVEGLIAQRALPSAPWRWTDDTHLEIKVLVGGRDASVADDYGWKCPLCSGKPIILRYSFVWSLLVRLSRTFGETKLPSSKRANIDF